MTYSHRHSHHRSHIRGVKAAPGKWPDIPIYYGSFWGSLGVHMKIRKGPDKNAPLEHDLFTPTFTPTRISYGGF